MSRAVSDLACPAEVHDEIRSSPHRIRTETKPIGVLKIVPGEVLYLRNHTCGGTMAFEVDVDAVSDDANRETT